MDKRRFAAAHGEVLIDICWDCHGFWFDRLESAQLAPAAVVELFRLIHEHRDRPVRPLAGQMACPSCAGPLTLTHDLQRANRIHYFRCARSHGRLTTFLQFLREKEFVRSLSAAEVERLRATVKQVRCSGCGAPVDVEKDAACNFCRAPLAILDPDAVNGALARWQGATARPANAANQQPDADAVLAALLAAETARLRPPVATRGHPEPALQAKLIDLVADGLATLFSR